MHCAEYRDIVAAHADDVLTLKEAALADAHVIACAQCAQLLDSARQFRQALRGHVWLRPTPNDLRARIVAALASEQQPIGQSAQLRQRWARPLFAAAAVAALLAVAFATLLPRSAQSPPPEPFAQIISDFKAAEAGQVQPDFRTDQPQELRDYYLRSGAFLFTNTVMDLEVMGYELIGGSVTDLGTRKSTLTLYRSGRGILVCHRIQNDGMVPPAGGEVVGGDTFYTIDGITICLHREGDVICFMASSLPRLEFIKQFTGHV
jgi:hypothetical protein